MCHVPSVSGLANYIIVLCYLFNPGILLQLFLHPTASWKEREKQNHCSTCSTRSYKVVKSPVIIQPPFASTSPKVNTHPFALYLFPYPLTSFAHSINISIKPFHDATSRFFTRSAPHHRALAFQRRCCRHIDYIGLRIVPVWFATLPRGAYRRIRSRGVRGRHAPFPNTCATSAPVSSTQSRLSIAISNDAYSPHSYYWRSIRPRHVATESARTDSPSVNDDAFPPWYVPLHPFAPLFFADARRIDSLHFAPHQGSDPSDTVFSGTADAAVKPCLNDSTSMTPLSTFNPVDLSAFTPQWSVPTQTLSELASAGDAVGPSPIPSSPIPLNLLPSFCRQHREAAAASQSSPVPFGSTSTATPQDESRSPTPDLTASDSSFDGETPETPHQQDETVPVPFGASSPSEEQYSYLANPTDAYIIDDICQDAQFSEHEMEQMGSWCPMDGESVYANEAQSPSEDIQGDDEVLSMPGLSQEHFNMCFSNRKFLLQTLTRADFSYRGEPLCRGRGAELCRAA